MKNDFYSQVGHYYDAEAIEFDTRYWNNPVLQEIRQAFREEVKKYQYKNMLEVGCGTGLDLVHFGSVHPDTEIHGIDVSEEMLVAAKLKIQQHELQHVEVHQATVEALPDLYSGRQFDMIYVFFGALNTTDSLEANARILTKMLSPGGTMVLSFVNKWYIAGMFLETIRLRFSRALARLRPVWGGYSPVKYLPSKCFTPHEIRQQFKTLNLINRAGFSILHPAWYFTRINQKIGRLSPVLWSIDKILNKSPFWRYGEYTLFTFQH